MNLSYVKQLYTISPQGGWDGALVGWIAWNLLPATLFGIAAALKKQGK
jgi:hypothetical protein